MKLITFILLCILPLHTAKATTDLSVSFQRVTLESRKKEDMDLSSQATRMTESTVGSLNKSKNGKLFIKPLNGDYRISSKFGNRKHPIRGKIAFHKGVDYAAKLGTPIHATAEGVIEYIGNNGGYGKYIRIKHTSEYSTCYAHISRFNNNVKLGSKVKQGEVIAYVGSTGAATGPHLHYEIIHNGKHIDPLTVGHTKLK